MTKVQKKKGCLYTQSFTLVQLICSFLYFCTNVIEVEIRTILTKFNINIGLSC